MIVFNGEQFPSMKGGGADTVLKLEALRHKRRHLPPKQKPADFTFTRKGAGQ